MKDREVGLVTGGANGIGRSVCLRLAAAGNSIGIVDRDGDGAQAVKDEIMETRDEAEVYCIDVTDCAS